MLEASLMIATLAAEDTRITNMKIENVTDTHIELWTKRGSCAQLDVFLGNLEDLGVKLSGPVFWFSRLKAKVEGEGEGTKLMERLVEILDERQITVVNGLNPYGEMDMEALTRFYTGYGFVSVGDGMMIRLPVESMDPAGSADE